MVEPLKPCPLCGNADIYVAPDEHGSGGQWVPPVHVGCKPCGLDLVDLVTDTREGAIAAWNRRTAPVPAGEREPSGEPQGVEVVAPLTTIMAWYQGLPKGAREKLSLHNLHTLSKALAATRSADDIAALPAPPAIAPAGVVEALSVIAAASERSETMFGGKMSEVTRVFQHITRVSREALASISPRAEGVEPWRPIETAPKDGTYVLAIVSGASDRWEHLNGRAFVIRHEGKTATDYDRGWSVFPGFGGAADDWFGGWRPLPVALTASPSPLEPPHDGE